MILEEALDFSQHSADVLILFPALLFVKQIIPHSPLILAYLILGCTPLILSATAGHTSTCHILLDHGADIEAQSDRTKDTALSLACSSGRQEVVELLLMSNANYEHRNVSDYTPLSLAASGGYVGIIKVLLNHGAEINSRYGLVRHLLTYLFICLFCFTLL